MEEIVREELETVRKWAMGKNRKRTYRRGRWKRANANDTRNARCDGEKETKDSGEGTRTKREGEGRRVEKKITSRKARGIRIVRKRGRKEATT